MSYFPFTKSDLAAIGRAAKSQIPHHLTSEKGEIAGAIRRLGDGKWEIVEESIRESEEGFTVPGSVSKEVYEGYVYDENDNYYFHTHPKMPALSYKYDFFPSVTDIETYILDTVAGLDNTAKPRFVIACDGVLAYQVNPAFIEWVGNEMRDNFFKSFPDGGSSYIREHFDKSYNKPQQMTLLMNVERNRNELMETISYNYNTMHIQLVASDEDLARFGDSRIFLDSYARRVGYLLGDFPDDIDNMPSLPEGTTDPDGNLWLLWLEQDIV